MPETIQNQKASTRLVSLDVFRGITIIGMILVNSPGNQTAYKQLNHSVWNGCTLADLVFPFFLFIVGVAVVFALTNRLARGDSFGQLFQKIFSRSVILFIISYLLNLFPRFHFLTIRILGVLPRIAICYFIVSLLFLKTNLRVQIIITILLLVGYWLVMTLVPVPGFGVGNLTPDGNLAAYIDRWLLAGHTYTPINDPEGILSTFPALATTLLGTFTGRWLMAEYAMQKKLGLMIAAGTVFLILGWIWGLWFPINKSLWTSSYVLWAAGLALYLLGLCYWLIEIKHWTRWSKPFEIFGVNAILAYVMHIFFLKIQHLIHIPRVDGSPGNLRFFITEHLYGWAPLKLASLLYAITYILFLLFILWILYRRKIFIRI